MVAGSIWGCHLSPERRENGFAESWHTTANKIQITALAHNETVLILDEHDGEDKKRGPAILDISFGLAENVEKARFTSTGSVRGWRLYFLSTSNYSLNELASRASIKIDDAERGRFVATFPCPTAATASTNMHQYADGRKFTDSLKIRCRKFFGVVGPAFVQKLVADRTKNAERLRKFLSRERIAYLQAINTQAQAEDLRPLNRASGRFATVFAAGSLAIKYEIFRWNRQDLLRAVLSCQLDGLRHSQAQHEQADTSVAGRLAEVVAYLLSHRSKFKNLDKAMPRRLGLGKTFLVRCRATRRHSRARNGTT